MPEEIATSPTKSEFLSRLVIQLHDPIDVQGLPIEELTGLKLKPLSSCESIEVENLSEEHGKDKGYAFVFIRGVVYPDGKRILCDSDVSTLDDSMGMVIRRALTKIRQISGQPDIDTPGEEKKIPLKKTPN